MKHKRVSRSWLGVPLYLTIGLAIFILASAIWDLSIKITWIRYLLIGSSLGIILISVLLNRIKLSTIRKIASKQMGV